MRILLTGASSFTGYWFASTLARAGHTIVAPLRGSSCTGSDNERNERLRKIGSMVDLVEDCSFGSERFLDLVASQNFDVLCLHHAEVENYRSPDFDIARALASNTHNLRAVLMRMRERGLMGVVQTGSFFEYDEGAGNAPRLAFSPYGLSKGLTAQVVRHRCLELGLRYGKFVVPHPFGPLEQPRLGAYLSKTWREGKVAEIRTPAYLRDNIHVDLLAACYRRFTEGTPSAAAQRQLNPSGYVESQGAFVQRMAREIGSRIDRECKVRLLHQSEFSEPMMRVNIDSAARYVEGWNESAAWDAYAQCFSD